MDDGVSQYQQQQQWSQLLLLPSWRRHELIIIRSSSAAENLSKPAVHYHYRRWRRHATFAQRTPLARARPRSCASRDACKVDVAHFPYCVRGGAKTLRTILSPSSFGLRFFGTRRRRQQLLWSAQPPTTTVNRPTSPTATAAVVV